MKWEVRSIFCKHSLTSTMELELERIPNTNSSTTPGAPLLLENRKRATPTSTKVTKFTAHSENPVLYKCIRDPRGVRRPDEVGGDGWPCATLSRPQCKGGAGGGGKSQRVTPVVMWLCDHVDICGQDEALKFDILYDATPELKVVDIYCASTSMVWQ